MIKTCRRRHKKKGIWTKSRNGTETHTDEQLLTILNRLPRKEANNKNNSCYRTDERRIENFLRISRELTINSVSSRFYLKKHYQIQIRIKSTGPQNENQNTNTPSRRVSGS